MPWTNALTLTEHLRETEVLLGSLPVLFSMPDGNSIPGDGSGRGLPGTHPALISCRLDNSHLCRGGGASRRGN
jgi:hypothetical protein